MQRQRRRAIAHRLRVPVSYLPQQILRFLHQHWKLMYDPADGWTFWLDASYYGWVRKDRKKHAA